MTNMTISDVIKHKFGIISTVDEFIAAWATMTMKETLGNLGMTSADIPTDQITKMIRDQIDFAAMTYATYDRRLIIKVIDIISRHVNDMSHEDRRKWCEGITSLVKLYKPNYVVYGAKLMN